MSAVADRPTGVVTFLFTDIEGSSRLEQRVGTAGGASPSLVKRSDYDQGARAAAGEAADAAWAAGQSMTMHAAVNAAMVRSRARSAGGCR